ncbi:MAG: ABC transporter permease subunit, partial [Tepidiformaceae bacterium]
VGHYNVSLPGIGSYVARAIQQKDILAIVWALLAMLFVILAYDQLLFRPLVAWAEKFRLGDTAAQYEPRSWVLDLFRRTRFLRNVAPVPGRLVGTLTARSRSRRASQPPKGAPRQLPAPVRRALPIAIYLVVAGGTIWGLWNLVSLIADAVSFRDALHVVVLGFYTLVRVLVLLAIASVIWIPVGVYVGLNARLAVRVQPVAQFLAAFPANLFFPIAVIVMVRFNLTPEVFTAPLMVLGTQWYILFNVIAGAAAIPIDLREAARNFGLSPWQRWRTLYLPGIFPYLVTGLLTASGGTWNASIVAEVVSWGHNTLTASGLGSYIADATLAQNYGKIVLGIVVMSIYVVALNHFVWRRLYRLANSRFRVA